MRKIGFVFIGLLLAFMFLCVSVYSQEDMEFVDNSTFDNFQRPPSIFKHDEHNETANIEECNVCHHVYEDGKLIEDESSEDQKCSECHAKEDENGKPNLMKAFHLNCKNCHLEKKSGPILCGECHKVFVK